MATEERSLMAETGRFPRTAPVPAAVEIDAPTMRRSAGDRITGGPVWGGFVVALASWITLEVLLVALTLTGVTAGPDPAPDQSAWWWSLLAAVVALFVGGLTAGAASRWQGPRDGLLLGVTVWALTMVALLVLSAVGAGIGFGAFGQLFGTGRVGTGQELPAAITDAAQDAALVALLVLGLTVVAAAAGGAVGAKIWPRNADRQSRP
ncbi:hypothetical protein O7627_29870 [Solwaraspora sp. WMMD1047]|uniref:hypothetical protein n=1 Tax=Solwaraspora sp. WMMD1047 TaxID=3016102 RepID=UPI00241651D7|nr:hypothetical protein [Solwaraspora sp. WMMD1047]MDG4833485.1 hypothetical protein [Solwaraspora sp. WMMD1047]